MDHFILPVGDFDRTVKKMITKGFVLSWTEQPDQTAEAWAEANGESKCGKRVKYVCREGELKAWAKHDAKLVRGEHMMPMVAQAAVPSASARLGLCEIIPGNRNRPHTYVRSRHT